MLGALYYLLGYRTDEIKCVEKTEIIITPRDPIDIKIEEEQLGPSDATKRARYLMLLQVREFGEYQKNKDLMPPDPPRLERSDGVLNSIYESAEIDGHMPMVNLTLKKKKNRKRV